MTKLTQNSWLGGQMDVRMTGRQDMRNYRNGASVLKNFVPVKLGSIRKRPGTDFVADVTEWVGSREFRMIPFGYLGGKGYVLVLCPDAEVDKARAFSADGTSVTVEGDVPYTAEELGQIGYVQCGDVVFLAHRNHPPAEIKHTKEVVEGVEVHHFKYSDVDFNPNKTKPTIGTISMTRQYFQDFTFSESDQATLDNCKSRGDFVNKDGWYNLYYSVYNDAGRRHYSGTTTVNYKASVVIDGSEGPLSDVKSLSFTSPWTESQVVKIGVKATIKADGKKWQMRLYKENGGVYGLVGTADEPNGDYKFEYNENLEYIGKHTSLWYKYSLVIDGVEGEERKNPKSQKKVKIEDEATGEEVTYINVTIEEKFSDYNHAVKVRLYQRDLNGGYVQYEDVAVDFNTVNVVFKDDNIAPDTSETPIDDSDGTPFSATDKYPGSVGLYQQRLVWASTNDYPARIWMSRAGDFYEYRPHVKLQLDDAIDFILPITQFANVNFIVELGRLFAFAECTELLVGSASDSQGVSYETIMATEHSHLGCTKRLPPIVANNTLLFVNRTGQSVRDYDERVGSSRFGGTDVSVFAAGIFADNPIVDWTWQQEPNSTVWCVLKDGRIASFTYDKEQEIGAWAVHELGGGGKAIGIAKTCAVFGRDAAHPTTGEVMVAVERGTGNARRVTLERMRPWGAANGREADRLCMDCMCDVINAKSDMLHLLVNGVDVYGYTFESVMTTMPPVIGDQVGQAQFDVKLGQHAHLRTVGSWGGEIYAVGMRNQAAKIDEGAVRDGEDGAEFRDVDVVLAGSNNRDGRVTVRHDEPGPFQLALLELDYEAEQ